jgi:hypothetical protein
MPRIRDSLGQGIRDATVLLRERSPGVLAGSIGTMVFDVAVRGTCFGARGFAFTEKSPRVFRLFTDRWSYEGTLEP